MPRYTGSEGILFCGIVSKPICRGSPGYFTETFYCFNGRPSSGTVFETRNRKSKLDIQSRNINSNENSNELQSAN